MISELVFIALDFYREPRRYPYLLNAHQPLPADMTALLAAPTTLFSDEQIQDSATDLNASLAECREVVPFFIKRVLIDTPGDYYRMLGLTNTADSHQIKQHYHYIIRLFHPDRDGGEENWDNIYAPRINEAYNVLRNSARRLEYDQSRPGKQSFGSANVTPPGAAYQPPAHHGRHSRSHEKPPMSPRLKKVALGLFVLVAAGFALLILSQPDQAALRVEISNELSAQIDEPESNSESHSEGVSVGRAESVTSRVGSLQSTEYQERPQPQLSVEEMIQQRVAEATAAVSVRSDRAGGVAHKNEQPPPAVPNASPAAVDGEQAVDMASVDTEIAPVFKSAQKPAPKQVSQQAPTQDIDLKNVAATRVVAPGETPASEPGKRSGSPAIGSEKVTKALVVDVDVKASKPKLEVEVESEPVQAESAPAEKAAPVEVVAAAITPRLRSAGARETKIVTTDPKREDASQPQSSSQITNQRTLMLLAVMMSSYQKGDLERFMGLFTEDAYTGVANGKPQIHAQYKDQFARPEQRRIIISKLHWENSGPRERIGSGEIKLEITPLDSNSPASSSTGPITLGVKFTPSGVKIKSLVYKGN